MKQYWIIKPLESKGGVIVDDHWKRFTDRKLNDGKEVIAIGWSKDLEIDLGSASKQDVYEYVYPKYGNGNPRVAHAATNNLWNFIHDMKFGDEVIVCKGYSANQKKPLYVYGIAEIIDKAWNHTDTSWHFHLKREVKYHQIIEDGFDITKFKALIRKDSLRQTIHKIDEDAFLKTKEWLLKY